MKRYLGKLLYYVGTGLLYMGAVVILVGLIFGWYKYGFGWVHDTFSPFNVWNYIAVIIVLGPGILLRTGGERLLEMASDEKNPRSSLDKLLGKKPEDMTADDFGNLADEIEAEREQVNAITDDLLAQMNSLSPEEAAWAEWFSQLSEPDKQFVEMCAKKDIPVNKDNFDEVLEVVKGQKTEK